jgi:peptidylprolyl isomerase
MTKKTGTGSIKTGTTTKTLGVLFATVVLTMACTSGVGSEQPAEVGIAQSGDIVTTESGLQYIDVEAGDGPAPEQGRLVTIHYTSWVSENGERGTKFDSSVDRGLPAPFTLKGEFYMRGWYEGISTMRVGGKRTLIIAPEVYGSEWAPPPDVAPVGSTLIFDIELLEAN